MITPAFNLRNHHLVLFVALGTAVRLAFGLHTTVWNTAHDQLAWNLSLEEMVARGAFIYKQLMHYPYEGGTFLISLVALPFLTLHKIMPALSIALLLIDTCIRFVQIKISRKIFGPVTAFWYGIWTILAIPELIPWGTCFVGLHATSALFPFIFMYFVLCPPAKMQRPVVAGVVAVVSIMYSYNNVILVPAYVLWIVFFEQNTRLKIQESLKFIFLLMLLMIPHVLIRLYADHGFHLDALAILPVRNKSWEDISVWSGLVNLVQTWWGTLPASVFISSAPGLSAFWHRNLALVLIAAGLITLIFLQKEKRAASVLGLLIVFFFSVAYSFSIFHTENISNKSFYFYRYFSFILPLLAVLIVHGFSGPFKYSLTCKVLWIVICGGFTVSYFFSSTSYSKPSFRTAGWILAKKFGDDPGMLVQLQSIAPADEKSELMKGFGWGLCATLLKDRHPDETVPIEKLGRLYNLIPNEQKAACKEGILYAFTAGLTPVLDKGFLPALNKSMPDDTGK